ncbi:MAG: hypothetical protein AB8G18_02850 [Gammaproteobacteria bacterium]
MSRKKTREKTKSELVEEVAELRGELNALHRVGNSNSWAKALQVVGPWIMAAVIAGFMSQAVKHIAGKETNFLLKADVNAGIEGELKVKALDEAVKLAKEEAFKVVYPAIFIGIGGILYGWSQRSLRRRTVERLHPYQEMYEKTLDPERSTSRLTKKGDTNPEDR